MYIGNVEIKGKTVLAPMAGVCNSAFRRIAKEMGCGLIYAEMVSDKAIYYDSKKVSIDDFKSCFSFTEEVPDRIETIYGLIKM